MKRKHGFTLIEILIVMLIISIVSGVAILSITHNQQKQLEQTAKKLARLITLADDEAMLKPATLGLGFSQTGYQFFHYEPSENEEDNHWKPLEDRHFGLQALPANVQIRILIEDHEMPLNGQPQIIISESGDITPFVLLIGKSGENPAYQVLSTAEGEVKSEPVDEK